MTFTTKSNKQLINDLQTDVNALVGASGLEIDETPTQNSLNAVTSNGVYDAFANIDLSSKQDKIEYNYDIPGVILTKLSEKQDLLDGQSEIKVRKLETNGTYGLDIEYQTISGNTIYLSTQNLYYKNSSSQNTLLNTTLDALQSAIDIIDISGKQDTITDNSLSISHVNNLQTALDGKATISDLSNKQNIITDNSLSISHVSNLQSELNGKATTADLNLKQDTITDNSLSISQVSNLQTALDSKKSNFTLLAGDNITFQNGISPDGDVITISASAIGGNTSSNLTVDEINFNPTPASISNHKQYFDTIYGTFIKTITNADSHNGDLLITADDRISFGRSTHTYGLVNIYQDLFIYDINDSICFNVNYSNGAVMFKRNGTLQNLNTVIDTLESASGGGSSSNQLSRTSYYTGDYFLIPNGTIDFYYNSANQIHNNLNITFTNQIGNASSGWFLDSGTYKIDYKCNFDNGNYQARLGIKNVFLFNGTEYQPSKCYGYGRHADYIDKQTLDCQFIYTVSGNGEYMSIRNNCTLNTKNYNEAWNFGMNVAGGFSLIITRIDQLDVVSTDLTAGENITIIDNVISATGGGSTYQAGSNITITEDNYILIDPNPVFTSTVSANKTKIGGSYSDRASLSHSDYISWRDMGIQQLENGTTIINSKSGTEVRFTHNGDVMAKFLNNDFYITRNNSLQNLNTILNSKQDTITSSTNTVINSLVVSPSLVSAPGAGDIVASGQISCSSLVVGSTNVVNELASKENTIVRKYAQPANNDAFPNGQNQWLQKASGITVENGETYLINCTWSCFVVSARLINHEAWIHVNGWQGLGTYQSFFNNNGVHVSVSSSFIWTNNFGTVGNPAIMIRNENDGYTDFNDKGSITMLKIS